MKTISIDPGIVEEGSFGVVARNQPGSLPRDRFSVLPFKEEVLAHGQRVLKRTYRREAAVKLLRAYNEALGHRAAGELCDRLLDPRALVVTVGQQPGLFGGPLMVLAKAAGAVLLARDLERTRGAPVVPLFWNHSEDHDQDEIRRLTILQDGSPRKLSVVLGKPGLSFDHLQVNEELVLFAREQLQRAGWEGHKETLLPREGEPYPTWVGRCLTVFLGELTILHVEPCVLRPMLKEFFGRALREVVALGEAVQEGLRGVLAHHQIPQVPTTEASQLFLVGREGQRLRLRYQEGFQVASTKGLEDLAGPGPLLDHLLRAAENKPARFSCNVLLRPVALQTLLPVVAHLGGPAEVNYFGQAKELFAWARVPMPAILPRPGLTILGKRQERLLEALGLQPQQVLEDPCSWPGGLKRDPHKSRGLEPLRADVKKDMRQRHELASWVHPRNQYQERVLGPLTLLEGRDPGSLGPLLASLDPWDFRHRLVIMEEDPAHEP